MGGNGDREELSYGEREERKRRKSNGRKEEQEKVII